MSTHFWDREVGSEAFHATNWMQSLPVRLYINANIGSAARPQWPFDWLREQLGGRRFRCALSIGCGTGALERDLLLRNLCERVDGFDGSVASLRIAVDEARKAGFARRAQYFAADFNNPVLPRRRYDLVLAHQAMHHVGKLEKLFRAVLHAITPDGLFYLDEYIGPSRHEWTEPLYAAQRQAFAKIPREYRFVDELPFPVVEQDPSEAIRSSEIIEQLAIGFTVSGMRGYGGNLLAPILPAVDWTKAPPAILERLLAAERDLLNSGSAPFHAIVLATPKKRWRKVAASLRYFAEPKLKRLTWEIKRKLRRHP